MINSYVSVPRVADAVVSELEKIIIDGILKPGQQLPPERLLAEQFGVSRPSVREALKQLAARGLIRTRHGGGNFVTGQLESSLVAPWQDMLHNHPGLQADMLETRRMLEGEVAALAAERATEPDRRRLATLFEELEAAYGSGELTAQSKADAAFHSAVADAAHNALLVHLTDGLLAILRPHVHENIGRLLSLAKVSEALLEQHRAIWQAIERRDGVAARAAAVAHIDFITASLALQHQDAQRLDRSERRMQLSGDDR